MDSFITFSIDDFLTCTRDNYNKIKKTLKKQKYHRWFKNLWEEGADVYDFYEIAKNIYRDVFHAELPFSAWDRAWQHRTVLHKNYKAAEEEFINATIGWY